MAITKFTQSISEPFNLSLDLLCLAAASFGPFGIRPFSLRPITIWPCTICPLTAWPIGFRQAQLADAVHQPLDLLREFARFVGILVTKFSQAVLQSLDLPFDFLSLTAAGLGTLGIRPLDFWLSTFWPSAFWSSAIATFLALFSPPLAFFAAPPANRVALILTVGPLVRSSFPFFASLALFLQDSNRRFGSNRIRKDVSDDICVNSRCGRIRRRRSTGKHRQRHAGERLPPRVHERSHLNFSLGRG